MVKVWLKDFQIAEREYKLVAALATHYHSDHIGGGMRGDNIAVQLRSSRAGAVARKRKAMGKA